MAMDARMMISEAVQEAVQEPVQEVVRGLLSVTAVPAGGIQSW